MFCVALGRQIAAVTVGAAEPNSRGLVHRRRVAAYMARIAAVGLGRDLLERLSGGRGRGGDAAVVALDRGFAFGGAQRVAGEEGGGEQRGHGEEAKHGAHQ